MPRFSRRPATGGWEESFRPLVEAALVALNRTGPPDGVRRIGLRYINEIRVPEIDSSPGDWRGYIYESLLSAAGPKLIPAGLHPTVWQGIAQYRTSADSTLMVRYGPQEGYAVDPQGPARRKNPPAPGGCSFCLIRIRSGTPRTRCRNLTPNGYSTVVTGFMHQSDE